jgi:hypothetical protein
MLPAASSGALGLRNRLSKAVREAEILRRLLKVAEQTERDLREPVKAAEGRR